MTRRASPRLRAYLLIGAAGLIAGAAFGRPEPVLVAAPMLLAAISGIVARSDPDVTAIASVATDRVLEGDAFEFTIVVTSKTPLRWVELVLVLPPGLVRVGPSLDAVAVDAGTERSLSVRATARRWGSYRIDQLRLRARDRFGFFAYETTIDPGIAVRVYPKPADVRRAIGAAETQVFSGDEVSRRRGDGIEFADVRPYSPGDQVRSVNWRLSSRRAELYVNDLHPERSTDVVILVDSYTDLVADQHSSTLSTALRGAYGIVNHYLRRRDRVGLISFGGRIRWLVPGMGPAQAYRIMDTLLDAEAASSAAWKRVALLPPGALPPKALVVALTPLLDDVVIETLLDLRGRGFDLAIVELAPEAYVQPAASASELTARRLWRMRRDLLHDRFRQLGVAVAIWAPDQPLDPVLQEVRTFRRAVRRASA